MFAGGYCFYSLCLYRVMLKFLNTNNICGKAVQFFVIFIPASNVYISWGVPHNTRQSVGGPTDVGVGC
ncbi:Uncharacterized protein APZ42_012347 [Daphnia magna]|uniref:Uncharacterized protein n=1 Tax=Daphnia magna TaxID=35525 RepID=A0A162RXB2_9CRUS|nr:Uncharacterized protein APZ42_012347 [Daphnia magna]